VEAARLYSSPARPPRLFGAAITADTARWVGGWADGLLTLSAEPAPLREVIEAFREGGGAGKPVYAQAALGWHPDEDEAHRAACRLWPVAVLSRDDTQDLPTPERFAAATAGVRPDDLRGKLRISSDLGRHAAWIRGDLDLGVERVFLHHVGGNPERCIETFAAKVLPAVGG
jgi:coenzyme F420-dependent glucose-6-phosphate dehydrogenase